MKTLKVKYTVEFEAEFEVQDDATLLQIQEEVANLEIPENKSTTYVGDSFEVHEIRDVNDNVLWNED